ncbi:putative transcription factor C2H2 family [Rosa chinensis]|uniref:Putative transcription factor C2H2 family n=1 Tax=Rosa chinensis TaxID=74649 RepID=A0A2P6R4C5_ROSCH|nr:zinc finger protein SHOOT GRAVITROPISM 5 [Rosa chinensis]PRQ41295.1 putative transcription factor C2H2 family [Rosa chinensis]
MLANNNHTNTSASSAAPSSSSDHHHAFTPLENGAAAAAATNKRKRRPAGTPDPDAEVVSLSPKTLLESDRYVCEICNQGFQRDQNLQMHRRRHKVPWKLLKREIQDQVKKRVFVCPEPSCLHHDPCHALGDLVGIKKHFRRKHSNHKQWVCDKCSKGYAVQSDYKAHLKTCGTRGHSCDCGRVFSRVESFIEHQDTCSVRHVVRPELQALQPAAACSSRTASSTSPSSDGHFSINNNNNAAPPLPGLPVMPKPNDQPVVFISSHEGHDGNPSTSNHQHQQPREQVLELKLLPSSDTQTSPRNEDENYATHLKLSIGGSSRGGDQKNDSPRSSSREMNTNIGFGGRASREVARLKDFASEELKLAMAEKAYAEDARREAKRQIEMAELEFANAKRIRQQAQAELQKAQLLKEQSTKKISSAIMQITCPSCKQHFHASNPSNAVGVGPSVDETTSLGMSYMSSATTEGEGEQ